MASLADGPKWHPSRRPAKVIRDAVTEAWQLTPDDADDHDDYTPEYRAAMQDASQAWHDARRKP